MSEQQTQVATATTKQNTALNTNKKVSITDNVLMAVNKRCEEGMILPENFNPVNSLKQAQVTLNMMQFEGKPILEVTTKASVANCLMASCMDGMDFVKNHCWFIPRKLKAPIKENVDGVEVEKYVELTLMEGIYGREAKMKRINPKYNAIVNFVKAGDEFEYSIDPLTGLTRIDKHTTTMANFDNDIVMAYTYTLDENNIQNVFIMSKKQWVQSWTASSNGGAVAKKYPEDFIIRTIIKKATKHIVKSNVGGSWVNEENDEPNVVDVTYTEVVEKPQSIDAKIALLPEPKRKNVEQKAEDEF